MFRAAESLLKACGAWLSALRSGPPSTGTPPTSAVLEQSSPYYAVVVLLCNIATVGGHRARTALTQLNICQLFQLFDVKLKNQCPVLITLLQLLEEHS